MDRSDRRTRARLVARVFATSLLLVASACGSSSPSDEIVTRSDPTANFTAFHTFAVQTQVPPGVTIPADVTANLAIVIEDSKKELVELGLTEVDPAVQTPDLWLFSLESTQTGEGYVWECVPSYSWWGYWGWLWNPCAWLEPVYVTFTEGTVVIGLADAKAEKVVFGGAIRGVLNGTADTTRLANDIAKVFDAYPATQTGTSGVDAGTDGGGTGGGGVYHREP